MKIRVPSLPQSAAALALLTLLPGAAFAQSQVFDAPKDFVSGSSPFSVARGDLNGDGKLDLVAANYGSNDVAVLLGNGDGTFQAAVNFAVGTNPHSVTLADLNGDGKLDVATSNLESNTVSVLLGQ